jgi:uncharacterized membrane protein
MTTASSSPSAIPPAPEASPSPLVQFAQRVESLQALDRLAPVLGAAGRPLAKGTVGKVLRGRPLGHAVHPFLTDLPIGFWTSSLVLDLAGGRGSRDSSRRLVGWGLASVLPTAATGVVEWRSLGTRDARTGSLHGTLNTVAAAFYTASWLSRRRGNHALGVALGVLGASTAGVSGYLGAHLAIARKVGSVNPEL